MTLTGITVQWLMDSALAAAVVLFLGGVLLWVVRQPAARQRLGEWTLGGCLVVAVLAACPALPRFSLGLMEAPGPSQLTGGQLTGVEANTAGGHGAARPVRPPAPGAPNAWHVAGAWLAAHGLVLLLVAYLAAASLAAMRMILAHVYLRRAVRRSRPPQDDLAREWASLVAALPRPVRLLVSAQVGRPITFGFLRPVVLVPDRLCGVSTREELRLILLHELVHVRRRDAGTWLLASLVQVLFFYQPMYWYLRRQMRLAQEYIADAWAAEHAVSPETYARNLLRLIREDIRPTPAAALASGAWLFPSEFYRRMQRLLSADQKPRWRAGAATSAALGCVVLLAAAGAGSLTLRAAMPHSAISAPQANAAEMRGVRFLLSHQETSGGWMSQLGPAPTALALKAVLGAGVPMSDAAVGRGLAFIERFRQPDHGYYRDAEPAYNTAIVLSLYAALPGAEYAQRVAAGRQFLRDVALSADKRPPGAWYAGSDAALAPAPWADADERSPSDVLNSYGSMSYSQLKSFMYAGLTRDDARVRIAARWITRNWTLDSNPGAGSADGLYYYYHLVARTLAAQGQDRIIDAAGRVHDWRAELRGKLVSTQRADGSWTNTRSSRWLEDQDVLVTAYSLLTLQETGN